MKKFLIVLGVLMLLIVTVIVAIPMLFQKELKELALSEANKTMNAKIEMEDFSLSLIPNFPKLTAEMYNVKLSGVNEFEGVTLFGAKTITTTFDLQKLFDGKIEIEEIGLDGVDLNILIYENGRANYDISKETTDSSEVTESNPTEEATDFKMKLKRYYFHNVNLQYDDRETNTLLQLTELNHDGKGDFTLSQFILETETSIKAINVEMEGQKLLKDARFDSEVNLAMDMDNFRFQFDTTFIQLNALVLNLDGWLAMPGDSVEMDIALSSKNNSFKELFSLIPNAYIEGYEDVKISGNMTIGAAFKGIYFEEFLPAYSIDLAVKNGQVKYPDLPATLDKIGIDLSISSPGGELNRMLLNLKRGHFEVAKNVFDMHLLVKNSITNPQMDGGLKMDFDLATIPTFMPVTDTEKYQGKVKVDVNFKADLNSLDHEQYDKVEADGSFEAWDIIYSDGVSLPMEISHMNMLFNMNRVDLLDFKSKMGTSDLQANGNLENFIPWYMNDATIVGDLNFISSYFNADEWLTEDIEDTSGNESASTETTSVEASTDSAAAETYALPTNIDFTLKSKISVLDYDSMKIENVSGVIKVKNGQILFENAKLDMFEGVATLNGVFDPTSKPLNPSFDFVVGIQNWAINPVANTYNSIEKLAPILKEASGTFSTELTTAGILDANLDPILEKLSFSGITTTKDLTITNSNLEKLNTITKTSNFNPLIAQNMTIKYTCKNGILETEPFDVKFGTQKAKVSGYTTLAEDINYLIDTQIKTADMGAGADAVINQINGLLGNNGIPAAVPDVIPLVISVTGKISDPKFKPVFGKGTGTTAVKQQVKEIVQEKIEEVKEDVKKQAQAEADKIIADAKKQQAEMMAEAKKQAQNLNAEAKKLGDQLRAEADKQGKDLISQASNPLAKMGAQKAADELNKQADTKAKKLEAEADAQGKKIVAETQKQSDKIVDDAKKKADATIQGI